MYKSKTLSTLITGFMLLSLSTLTAGEVSASDIITKAFKHTSSLKSYAFHATIAEEEAQEDGTFITYNYTRAVKVNRPAQLRIDSKGKYLDNTTTLDHGLYTVVRHKDKTYSQLTVPKSIDEAIEAVLDKYTLQKAPLASLVYNDPAKHVKLDKALYLGKDTLDAVVCDHVRFSKKNRVVDIWVTQSKTPQIIAYHINDTNNQPPVHIKAKITWDEKPNISPKDFVFQAPKESKKVEILTEDSEG